MKTKTPKEKTIRARRMYACGELDRNFTDQFFTGIRKPPAYLHPVAVLDVSQPEKLVHQVACKLAHFDGNNWANYPVMSVYGLQARTILNSIGILPAQRKGRH